MLFAADRGSGALRLRPQVFNEHRKEVGERGVVLTESVDPIECAHPFTRPDWAGEFCSIICDNCGHRGPEMLTEIHATAAFLRGCP